MRQWTCPCKYYQDTSTCIASSVVRLILSSLDQHTVFLLAKEVREKKLSTVAIT